MTRNIWIGIVVVVVLVAGGWWYLNQSSTPAVSETTQLPTAQDTNVGTQAAAKPAPNNETANWKTYKSTKYGYSIQYPATAFISENLSGACPNTVLSDANKSWFITIVWDDGSSPCFGTGISISSREISDTFVVGGAQITARGRADDDNPFGSFLFAFNRVTIRYGVSVANTTQEYTVKLNAMHDILSTLKSI